MVTLAQAKKLAQGATLHHKKLRNADGTPMRAKVLNTKTWKTRPGEVLVSLKHGMYDFTKIDERQINDWTAKPVKVSKKKR